MNIEIQKINLSEIFFFCYYVVHSLILYRKYFIDVSYLVLLDMPSLVICASLCICLVQDSDCSLYQQQQEVKTSWEVTINSGDLDLFTLKCWCYQFLWLC